MTTVCRCAEAGRKGGAKAAGVSSDRSKKHALHDVEMSSQHLVPRAPYLRISIPVLKPDWGEIKKTRVLVAK